MAAREPRLISVRRPAALDRRSHERAGEALTGQALRSHVRHPHHVRRQVADLLTYRGIVAEVAPGQTAEAAECIFWLKNRRYATIVPHIEFRIGAHTSKRTIEQRVSDKADYLRRIHRVRSIFVCVARACPVHPALRAPQI